MAHELYGPLIGALAGILGLYLTVAKLKKGFKDELQEETGKAIVSAREAARHDVELLKARTESLEKEIQQLESTLRQTMEHMKDTHDSEIRNLSEKIESLRDEVRDQHGQLVALLTKLVSDR